VAIAEEKVRKSVTGRTQKDIYESAVRIFKDLNPAVYGDFSENDPVIMVLEAVSYMVDNLLYTIDKNYLGLNPKTADTESAKANIISSYGGHLDFYVGSYGYVKGYLKTGYTNTIIPRYTKVTIGDEICYVSSEVSIDSGTVLTDAGGDYVRIPVREGEVKSTTYSFDEPVNNKLTIQEADTVETGVDYNSVSVSNQGVWTFCEDVYFEAIDIGSGAVPKYFSLGKTLDRMPIIELMTDWDQYINYYQTNSFEVQYAVTKGREVLINADVSAAVDHESIDSAVTLEAIKGGYSPNYDMDIQMKKVIEENRTLYTAITIEDFERLSREHESVSDSVAYDIDSVRLDEINAHLASIGQGPVEPLQILVSFVDYFGEIPNTLLRDEALALLDTRRLMLFEIRWVPPVIVDIDYTVTVQTIGDSLKITDDEIYKVIDALYKNVTKFGSALPVSNSSIVAAVHGISNSVYSVDVVDTKIDNATSTVITDLNPFCFSRLGTVTVNLTVLGDYL